MIRDIDKEVGVEEGHDGEGNLEGRVARGE